MCIKVEEDGRKRKVWLNAKKSGTRVGQAEAASSSLSHSLCARLWEFLRIMIVGDGGKTGYN